MCCGIIVGVVVALAIGSLVLRASVWLSNKLIPQPSASKRYYNDDDDDDDDEDDDDDDEEWGSSQRRRRRSRARGRTRSAIPEPSFGWGMLICFVAWIISAGVGFVMGFVAGLGGLAKNQAAMLGLQGCSIIVSYFIWSGIISAMLPTSPPRGFLVGLFMFLIWIAICVVIFLFLVAIVGMKAFR
jgi:hypothetical protein